MSTWKEKIQQEEQGKMDAVEKERQEEQERLQKGFEYDSRFWTSIDPKALFEEINRDIWENKGQIKSISAHTKGMNSLGLASAIFSRVSLETSYPVISEKKGNISKKVFGKYTVHVDTSSGGPDGIIPSGYSYEKTGWHDVRGDKTIGYEEEKKLSKLELTFQGYRNFSYGMCRLSLRDNEIDFNLKYSSGLGSIKEVHLEEGGRPPMFAGKYLPTDPSIDMNYRNTIYLDFLGADFNKDLISSFLEKALIQSCKPRAQSPFSERVRKANNEIAKITSRIGEERWIES